MVVGADTLGRAESAREGKGALERAAELAAAAARRLAALRAKESGSGG